MDGLGLVQNRQDGKGIYSSKVEWKRSAVVRERYRHDHHRHRHHFCRHHCRRHRRREGACQGGCCREGCQLERAGSSNGEVVGDG